MHVVRHGTRRLMADPNEFVITPSCNNRCRKMRGSSSGENPFHKRRTNDRALAYWRELRGDRVFPRPQDVSLEADLEFEGLERLWPNIFVVYFKTNPEESVFTLASAVLDSLCEAPTIDRRLADCLPATLRESVLSFVHGIARAHKPLSVSSHFVTDHGIDVLYRSIFLPLSSDQGTVDFLLGAFSYRPLSAS